MELISSVQPDNDFTRGDAVVIFWNAMDAELVGTGYTLKESLIAQGVIEEEVYTEAEEISQSGRKENPGVPVIPPMIDIPSSSENNGNTELPAVPEIPSTPETPVIPVSPITPDNSEQIKPDSEFGSSGMDEWDD